MFWTFTVSALITLLTAAGAVFGRRWRTRRRAVGRAIFCGAVLIGLPAAAMAGYLAVCWAGGVPGEMSKSLGRGVTYRRIVRAVPPAVTHVVEIADPADRQWCVTPPVDTADGPRNRATDAVTSADALGADLLINANFFTPFWDNFVFSFHPHAGDAIEPIGTVVADGVRYGRPKPQWPSFWVANGPGRAGRPDVGFGEVPADARFAVTGRQWLLHDGVVTAEATDDRYPRTALALSADRRRMWLVIVDGKQPNYSVGLTYRELADVIAALGASDAIELDGGGSSVLVARDAGLAKVLSRPCHTQIPRRLRPTGVFLGLRF